MKELVGPSASVGGSQSPAAGCVHADIVVGGSNPADRNVISGNYYAQVMIDSYPGNAVEGNRIGTNATGTAAVSSSGSLDYYGVVLKSSGTRSTTT
jgi:hypothetical protein